MVLTITISDELVKEVDAIRKSEARASYIRRAIEEKLERERVKTQPVKEG